MHITILQIVVRSLPPTTYEETISDTTLLVTGGVLVGLVVLAIGALVWWLRARSR
jgi:hypothetical protein